LQLTDTLSLIFLAVAQFLTNFTLIMLFSYEKTM